MKIQISKVVLLSILLLATSITAQTLNTAYLSYIEQYHLLAEKQQKEYGIPASITLAQGLLESGAGKSFLSISSNNHFGIKCAEWTGDKMYHDDDEKGECFRKYNEVVDSYEDHSAFLRNRSRYASLFMLTQTDYEGWAFGLKKAGYATDPTYAYKLISIIETYELQKFDNGDYFSNNEIKLQEIQQKQEKNERGRKSGHYGGMGTVKAFTTHEMKKVNGVLFVTAIKGDSYSAIADEFNIKQYEIFNYNDIEQGADLKAGTRVYIAQKKKKAPKECLTHRVLVGESMRSISQDYGIKVVELYKLNNMPFADGAKLGTILKLR
jgi:LysM repeat protein